MKKSIFALFIVSVLSIGSAFAQMSFGVKGAFNMNKFYGSSFYDDAKLIPAGNVGVFADFQIADGFYIRPELNYANKGSKFEKSVSLLGVTTKTTTTSRIHYLEIPVTFQYKAMLGEGNLILGGGPYMGIGLGGKNKFTADVNGNSTDKSEDIEFGNEQGKLKRMDFGGKFYAGYELPMGLGFGLETNLGLSNLSNDNDPKTKNIGFGLFLSYRIK